jgi:hypothetical protein
MQEIMVQEGLMAMMVTMGTVLKRATLMSLT